MRHVENDRHSLGEGDRAGEGRVFFPSSTRWPKRVSEVRCPWQRVTDASVWLFTTLPSDSPPNFPQQCSSCTQIPFFSCLVVVVNQKSRCINSQFYPWHSFLILKLAHHKHTHHADTLILILDHTSTIDYSFSSIDLDTRFS